MFKETKEGQTHSDNDGCEEPAHNGMKYPSSLTIIKNDMNNTLKSFLGLSFGFALALCFISVITLVWTMDFFWLKVLITAMLYGIFALIVYATNND
jgi:hypothetical protein